MERSGVTAVAVTPDPAPPATSFVSYAERG